LKFTHFTDYTQPNTALKNGDIDLNAFQHYAFLNAWNKANDGDLKAIGNTTISPIRLYSKKITALSQIKSGDTIAVPNDASNESRALYVLKNAGLIGLSVSGDTLATVKDINSNPKNLVIKELDAAQTPRALDSITAAVINDDFATTAKLTVEESIYTEPVNKDSEQWINIIVANKKDANNKIYKEVVKAYQTEATKKAIEKAYPDKRKIAAWGLKLD
ncbi:MAG: MetQ/NlpA family ABC transporter substrate-binding protein, partial [Lactococcus lactis]